MNRQEFLLASGQRVTVDKDAISFYGPHESGNGTHVVVGGYADGLHLHFADDYPEVRAELTMRDVDWFVREMREGDHKEKIDSAQNHARAVERQYDVIVHLLNQKTGIRIEVDARTSSRHAEDARTWDELDEGTTDQLERIIDELAEAVNPLS